ncbi:MAG: hypothetical protein OEM38_04630, partial [Gammaproteobacteria bacterium]|nr:hypothetical protein [Gammaproteobacteria bacterium]
MSACTSHQVKRGEVVNVEQVSTITLANKQQLRTNGFKLKDDQVTVSINNAESILETKDIEKIVSVDRYRGLKYGAYAGAAVGVAVSVDILLGMDSWLAFLIPVVMVAYPAMGGGAGYLVGHRTVYDFNPPREISVTQKTNNVTPNLSEIQTGSPFHIGLNLGVGGGRMPKMRDYPTDAGKETSVKDVLGVSLEIGGRYNSNFIVGGHISSFNTTSFDPNRPLAVDRSISSIGPDLTYFPHRYGFYMKGGFDLASMNMSVRPDTQTETVNYTKDYGGYGLFAGGGYAYPISTHLHVGVEALAHAYQFSGIENPVLTTISVGL